MDRTICAPAHEAGGFFLKVRSSAWETGVLLNYEHLQTEQRVISIA
jgi:hypothetical protein